MEPPPFPIRRRAPHALTLVAVSEGVRAGGAEEGMWLEQSSAKWIIGWGPEDVPEPSRLGAKNERRKAECRTAAAKFLGGRCN